MQSRSRVSRLLGFLVVALTALAGGAAETLGEVPDLLTYDDRPQLIWRSLASSQTGGAMRWEMFSESEQHTIGLEVSQGRRMGAGTCLHTEPLIGDVPYFETLSETTEHSAAIYVGTVTDAKPGFLGTLLGTAYELSVERDFKDGTAGPVPHHVLVFYPVAEAQVDGVRLCPVGWRGGVHPKIGGRLLIFASDGILASGPVLRPNDYDFVFETAEGTLSVPSNLRELANLDLAATDMSLIEDHIENLVTEKRR